MSSSFDSNFGTSSGNVNDPVITVRGVDAVCAVPTVSPLKALMTFLSLKVPRTESLSALI